MKIYCTYNASISDGTPNITGYYNSEVNAELFDIVEQVEEVDGGENRITTIHTAKEGTILDGSVQLTEEQWLLSTQGLLYIDADETPQVYTPTEKTAQELLDEEVAAIFKQRKYRYRTESDPIRLEAEYDAIVSGTAIDTSEWVAKVQQIKAELPLPDTMN